MDSRDHHAVSKEAVFSVLDELQAAGIKPTVTDVRERFSASSYSLIAHYLAEWNMLLHQSIPVTFPPPPEKVSQGLSRLWAQARLISDEEVEQERLKLGYQRQAFEQEKRDMLLEIERLEKEFKPQEALSDLFDSERSKLEGQLSLLHDNLKEVKLNEVGAVADKQRLERDISVLKLQQTQLQVELDEKIGFIKKVVEEKDALQDRLTTYDGTQKEELNRTRQMLSVANDQIKTLLSQFEQQRLAPGAIEQITGLEKQIENLQARLLTSQTNLHESEVVQSELHSKQGISDRQLNEAMQRNKELEHNYNKVKLELDTMRNSSDISDRRDIDELSGQVEALSGKLAQYRQGLKDKQKRYNLLLKHYERLKQQNKALIESETLPPAVSPRPVSPEVNQGQSIEPVMRNREDGAGSDASRDIKDGEKILELAHRFTILDRQKVRGEK